MDDEKVMIWYYKYNPWVMGGRVHQPVQEFVDIIEERDMGKGIICFSFILSNGEMGIADQATRGLVGNTFEQVQKDVDEGDPEVMRKQQERFLKVLEDEGWVITK